MKKNAAYHDYDSPWKNFLTQYFEAFILFFLPELHQQIDWSVPIKFLEQDLKKTARSTKAKNRIADKIVQVHLHSNQSVLLIIHLEIQAQPDDQIEERMFVTFFRLFERYQLPIYSVLVLTDDKPTWRPQKFATSFGPCKVQMDFITIKLLDYATRLQEFLNSDSPVAWMVAAHLSVLLAHNDLELLSYKKRLVRQLLCQQKLSKQTIQELFFLLDWIITLPEELVINFENDLNMIEQETGKMAYISSIEQLGIDRGMEKGMQKAILILTLHQQGKSFAEIASQLQIDQALVEQIVKASLPSQ